MCRERSFLPVRAGSLCLIGIFYLEFYSPLWCNGERTLMCLSGVFVQGEKRSADIRSMKNCMWNMTAEWPSPWHQGITGGSINKAVSRQFKPFKLLISQQQPPNNQFSTVSASLLFLVWGVSEGKVTLITKNNSTDFGETVVFSDIFYFLRGVLFVFLTSKIVQLLHL